MDGAIKTNRKYPAYSLAELEAKVAAGYGNAVMIEEIAARKAGVKFEGKVFDLPDLVKGKLDAKVKAADITMYRSAGTGLQDVVVAELAWRRALEKGLAVELPMQLFHKTVAPRAPAPQTAPAR